MGKIERSFVLWEDFKALFRGSGLEPHVSKGGFFSRTDAGRNCLETKQDKLLERRKMDELSDEEYREINDQYTNISEQITEYEKAINSFHSDP